MSAQQQELLALSGVASGVVDIGDNIANSIMLDSTASQYLSRTNTTSAAFTFAIACKRGKMGQISPLLETSILFNANDTLTAFGLTTTAVFRDPSAWYFIHVSNNGLYVNGVSYGAVTTSALTNPRIGFDGTHYFDGYIAMCYLVDGTADVYTNYGRISADTGAWVNKNATPTYGAKGSLLNFTNSGALGTDSSGNGNNWTLNGGISSANQYTDTPTNNYCVLNSLSKVTTAALSKGNLVQNATTIAIGTIGMSTGSFYWEVATATAATSLGVYNTAASTTISAAAGKTYGMRFNASTGALDYINITDAGAWTSLATGLTSGPYFPYASEASTAVATWNFGARAWTGSLPATYLPLSTANLPQPAIIKPSLFFNADTYTGNGGAVIVRDNVGISTTVTSVAPTYVNTPYNISNSLLFDSTQSQYLSRTFSAPTSSTIYTLSTWIKRGKLGAAFNIFGASTTTSFIFNSSNQLNVTLGGTSAATSSAITDTTDWVHVMYVQNGSAQTIYAGGLSVATGTTANTVFNTAVAHQLGAANTAGYFDGYVAETRFIDGQALTPYSFGALDSATGCWLPINYTGTYGANGFYLPFSNATSTTTLGYDTGTIDGVHTAANNWTLVAMTTANQFSDCPSTNYCVFSPLSPTTATLSKGNRVTNSSTVAAGTMPMLSPLATYWEVSSAGGATSAGIYGTAASTLISIAAGLTYGLRFNAGTGVLDYTTNGSSWTNLATVITGLNYVVYVSTAASAVATLNTGQLPFMYSVPTGFTS